MTRIAVTLTMLACLGPLASASAAKDAVFIGGGAATGALIGVVTQTSGGIRVHAIIRYGGASKPATLSLAHGRCGHRAGTRLIVAAGTLSAPGLNLTERFRTDVKVAQLNSLRMAAKGGAVRCVDGAGLTRAKQSRRRANVTVTDLGAGDPIAGGLVVTGDEDGRLTHHSIFASPDVPTHLGGAGRHASRAAAGPLDDATISLRDRKAEEIASFPVPSGSDADVFAFHGNIASEFFVAPRARTLEIRNQTDQIAMADVRRFALRRCAYPICGG
jgi:hypothetical protein